MTDTKFGITALIVLSNIAAILIFFIVSQERKLEAAQKAAYAECVTKANDSEWCAETIHEIKLR